MRGQVIFYRRLEYILIEFINFLKLKKILNLVQALKDNKSPFQLVQMPCVTVELTKFKHDKTTNQPHTQYQLQHQVSTTSRERLDSDIQFKQSFSSKSPLFSCW